MVRAPRGESLFGRQPRGVAGDKPGAFRPEVLRGRRGDDRDGRRARAVRLRSHRDGVVRRLRASRQRGPTGALPRDARREDRADLLGRRHRVSHRGLRRARGHRRGHDARAAGHDARGGALRHERGLRRCLRRRRLRRRRLYGEDDLFVGDVQRRAGGVRRGVPRRRARGGDGQVLRRRQVLPDLGPAATRRARSSGGNAFTDGRRRRKTRIERRWRFGSGEGFAVEKTRVRVPGGGVVHAGTQPARGRVPGVRGGTRFFIHGEHPVRNKRVRTGDGVGGTRKRHDDTKRHAEPVPGPPRVGSHRAFVEWREFRVCGGVNGGAVFGERAETRRHFRLGRARGFGGCL